MDFIIVIAALFHLISSPFTKVEESFNLQACHDILYHGFYLSEYDHLEFSGVVPRTFIGPLLISFISMPIVTVFRVLGLPKFYSQYVVRFVLGALVVLAWKHLRLQVLKTFGKPLTIWFTFITASQFHFIYYLSRPLPNVFALIFALLSFSFWLQQRHKMLILSSGIAVLIFRSELCLLLGPMLLYDLARRKVMIVQFLKCAIPVGVACLSATILIDSVFWGRLVWPEGEVFWFNTYKNQSHQWGVYPFLWYWYSCLPRALVLSFPLVPVGIAIDPRVRALVAPGILFVALYSFLPHKELRFIIYVFPLFNIAAARACQFFWASRLKSRSRKLLAIGSALHILANVVFTSLLLTVSASNYPGGAAVHRFHQMVPPTEHVHLHIDNFSAQTGVTRFTELHSHWRYNKTENLKAGGAAIRTFTHLLVEAKSKYAYNLKHYTVSHEILDSVDAFSHLSFNYFSFPPVKVRSKPAIFLLKNLQKDDVDWSFLPQEDQSAERASEDSFIENPKAEVEVPPKPSSESSGLDAAAAQGPGENDLPKAASKKGKKKKKKKSLPPNEEEAVVEEGNGEESSPKRGTRKNPAKVDNEARSQPTQSPDMENKDGEI